MSNNILQLLYGLPKKNKKNPPKNPSTHFKVSPKNKIPKFLKMTCFLLFTSAHYLLNISFNLNEKVLPIWYLLLMKSPKRLYLKGPCYSRCLKRDFLCDVFSENWRGSDTLPVLRQLTWQNGQSGRWISRPFPTHT